MIFLFISVITIHGLPSSIIVTPNALVPDIYGWVRTVTPNLKRIRTTFSYPCTLSKVNSLILLIIQLINHGYIRTDY